VRDSEGNLMRGREKKAGAALAVVIAIFGCGKAKEEFDRSFKESYLKSFTDSCTKGATDKGAPVEKVKPVCTCMARYLIDHHDPIALAKASSTATSEEFQQFLREAVQSCKQ
jgi:hypothetical protein